MSRYRRPHVRRVLRMVVAACVAATAATAAVAPAAADPQPPTVCPATVVLAARGSGEPQTHPQVFDGGRVTTDGWEGGMIARTLSHANLADSVVWGLTGNDYPAPFFTTGSGTAVSDATISGVVNGVRRIRHFEQSTGCRPSYLLIGYSQGAAVMHLLEPIVAQSGRLIGAAYMGDPFLARFDPQLVGPNKSGGGMVYSGSAAFDSTLWRTRGTSVVEYCADRDPVCRYPGNVEQFSDDFGHHVAYFRPGTQHPEDTEFIARVNSMLDVGRQRHAAGATAHSPIPWAWNSFS